MPFSGRNVVTLVTHASCHKGFTVSSVCMPICNSRPMLCSGCHCQFPYNIFGTHQEECDDVIVVCRHEGCNGRVLRKDLQVHEQACGHGLVKHRGCGTLVRRMDLDQHRRACAQATMPSSYEQGQQSPPQKQQSSQEEHSRSSTTSSKIVPRIAHNIHTDVCRRSQKDRPCV